MNYELIFDWILEVPQVIAKFSTWLVTPINETYLNISPLGLLGLSGINIFIALIGLHVVRLFV